MPEWELVRYVERLHRRYHARVVQLVDRLRKDWPLGDEDESGPGAHRPGGLVARLVSQRLEGTGVFLYAAHPSQAEEEEEECSGPRWYVSCMEAAMRRYGARGVAPPPPAELQELLWPDMRDRCRPWLTELGWTLVPESSDPQVVHADICSASGEHPRRPGRGRFHHFAWKLRPGESCTTHVIPGSFTEGSVEWEHYSQWTQVCAPAVIFDSEMLHRGGPTCRGGWTSTLTLQVCSGSGWRDLQERVSPSLMWYTQPMGWVAGDAVEALVDGAWHPALVEARSDTGHYRVALRDGEAHAQGLADRDLRCRQHPAEAPAGAAGFPVGSLVEALFEGHWHAAKVAQCNADGTFRVTWRAERSCTDGLPPAALRAPRSTPRAAAEDLGADRARKRRRTSSPGSRGSRNSRGSEASGTSSTGCPSDREACSSTQLARRQRSRLFRMGWVELRGGLPKSWAWPVFDFVEAYHARFCELVVQELDSLREVWAPCRGSQSRYGAFAAAKASERLKAYGLAVYSPGQSHMECPPFEVSGPRWYVSATAAAIEHFGVAPSPPPELHRLLFGHLADCAGEPRARGLGWTLAPPGSDPQCLHADIWGVQGHARGDRTRWPHILWKRSPSELCTTQIVPGAFTEGEVAERHFSQIVQVRAPAIVVDSEVLHRGGPTLPAPAGAPAPAGWVSSLSLELCSPSGWAAWEAFATGGTTKDPTSPLDWRMLRIKPAAADLGQPGAAPELAAPELSPAPWQGAAGLEQLRAEQRRWELEW